MNKSAHFLSCNDKKDNNVGPRGGASAWKSRGGTKWLHRGNKMKEMRANPKLIALSTVALVTTVFDPSEVCMRSRDVIPANSFKKTRMLCVRSRKFSCPARAEIAPRVQQRNVWSRTSKIASFPGMKDLSLSLSMDAKAEEWHVDDRGTEVVYALATIVRDQFISSWGGHTQTWRHLIPHVMLLYNLAR